MSTPRIPIAIGTNGNLTEVPAGDPTVLQHPCGSGGTPTVTTTGIAAGITVSVAGTDASGELTVTTTALLSIAVGATIKVTFATAYVGRPFVNLSASTTNAISAAAATSQTNTDFTVTIALSLGLVAATYKWVWTTIGPVGG